ncbi:precorrin-6y C5,15-methyltransferase (decarboxylating) subunit CbiE [Sulfolobus sp. A20]|uniref:cobalt-precorrin-7 (C(5))-methyltransferase n=1 Tax=Sulfolobaceae TaxID=118883 RepID=UPI00084611EE|nr:MULTISPECIES: cobalt-precorrin-7 (C(5))-methyltransferase [unclassified Sulfolobus]TRM74407.1 cobalt-precorrin-7 (C(5))-methyltransferase [Sulfolobus sp. E5]TRM75478.1 cobalt-precorrin-7 (C(5))-methyltransferase [Sulfolobus sp. A20-N-F8]TRM81140.1 cobalt-precorrin-7 (C(5))-methyltransferase [Sulfolobus sp. D5]TRM86763.1 cobalt-precorrin-7 (C(5))-methyltransferase [Sulfolobus sp. E3]TRM89382.1 cobalt-precorrin-7 (C(5))-methyltransferase [Sulfolobus sp. C3]TRM92076.1 cobalt-precorrin-7 (C(5)
MVVYIIGVGPGDPEYLTLKGYKAIKDSKIVVGWKGVIDRFSPILEGKEIVILDYKNELEQLNQVVEKAKGENIAILNHGDPSVSDWQFVEKIRNICADKNVKVTIISGVSSLNVLLAKLGLDMNFIGFVTLHVRGDISDYLRNILQILEMGRVAIVIPEPYNDGPQRVAKYLYQNGLNCRVAVFEKLTYENESLRYYDNLISLINDSHNFSDLTIMAIFSK